MMIGFQQTIHIFLVIYVIIRLLCKHHSCIICDSFLNIEPIYLFKMSCVLCASILSRCVRNDSEVFFNCSILLLGIMYRIELQYSKFTEVSNLKMCITPISMRCIIECQYTNIMIFQNNA